MEGLTRPGGTAAPDQPGHPGGGRYTGVLLVHGVGVDERNDALQAYINALAYWFNHVARLAYRPRGTGRLWVRTRLTDDNRPDAAPSRATIELVAPAERAAVHEQSSPTELEFREIWWARSFGVPSPEMGLQVIRAMYREGLFRVLRTWLLRRGTRRPSSYHQASMERGARRIVREIVRLPQRAVILVYEIVQELWKAGQWLVSIPFAFSLLFLLRVARWVQPLPFLGRIVASIGGTFSTLGWMASVQVYLVDYTRSVAMRYRFKCELEDLLADPRCERIVVLAHSMGTVISYEGLTDVIGTQTGNPLPKPITFICLGQVLQRVWHLARSDPHRLRDALPQAVRWVNFYARYDPISAGALDPRALPPAPGGDGSAADATTRASLARCENHVVVNRDSLLYDHMTYFNNLEQVIGPIARELVAGHAALEAQVSGYLATRDDVLQRHWGLVWRSGLPLVAGVAAGVETLLLGREYHLGTATRTLVGQILAGGAALPGFFGLLWRLAGQLIGWLVGEIGGLIAAALGATLGSDRASPLLRQVGMGATAATDVVILIVAVLLATSLAVVLVAQILAPPLPYKFQTPFEESDQRPPRARAQPRSAPRDREPASVAPRARPDVRAG